MNKTIEVSFWFCGKDLISIIREKFLGDWLGIKFLVILIEIGAEKDGLYGILDETDKESKLEDVDKEAEDKGKDAYVTISCVFHVDKAY